MTASPRHIHLSGICGTAMASLAGLLQLQGHRITGSDKAAYPPMSDLLRGLGIPILEPYAETKLDPRPDLVVIGNALSRGNPEVERVLDEIEGPEHLVIRVRVQPAEAVHEQVADDVGPHDVARQAGQQIFHRVAGQALESDKAKWIRALEVVQLTARELGSSLDVVGCVRPSQ